jgi:hypothetical protein
MIESFFKKAKINFRYLQSGKMIFRINLTKLKDYS